MTSQHTADYPTLQEVLRLPVFAGCTVCGGAAGLGRRVSGVNLTDTPDYVRWLAQGELLITTGFAIADDPQAVDALLPTAAEKGLSGVGISRGATCPAPCRRRWRRRLTDWDCRCSNCRPICALPSWPMRCPARSHGGEYRRNRSGSWPYYCTISSLARR